MNKTKTMYRLRCGKWTQRRKRAVKVMTKEGEIQWTARGLAIYWGVKKSSVMLMVKRGKLRAVNLHSRPYTFTKAEAKRAWRDWWS